MTETWKYVEETDNKYQVSDKGRVRNSLTGKILSPYIDRTGRRRVCLSIKGTQRVELVSRLVANAFIPKPLDCFRVKHVSDNKSDDSVDNLFWARGGIFNKVGRIRCVETNEEFPSCYEASKKMNIDRSLIYSALKTGGVTQGKYHFEKVQEVTDDVER